MYGNAISDNWPWFPILYVYDNEYDSQIMGFTKRMISREFIEDILPLFGYKEIDEIRKKFKEIEDLPRGAFRDIRYGEAFNSAPKLGDYITSDKIGTLR